MITENGHGGYEQVNEAGYVEDDKRIDITAKFLHYLLKAKKEGVHVQGYYHWSAMDLYSWINGYEKRYGLIRVDFAKDLALTPKKSYYWYRDFIDHYFDGSMKDD